MIKFNNGHELTFAVASGALAFDGRGWWWEHPLRWLGIINPKLFTVVAKTVTMEPKVGNLKMWHPWTCVKFLKCRKTGHRGMVNAVGLTNPGIDRWIARDYPTAIRKGYKIAASIKPETLSEAAQMGSKLSNLDLSYVEVNLSCPNVENHDNLHMIKAQLAAIKQFRHPVVLKLSLNQCTERFINMVDGEVDAFHAINTIPWNDMFPGTASPIEKYKHGQKGGVSGDFILERATKAVRDIKQMTNKPVIGGGGIMNIHNVHQFEWAGATAFSIGMCFTITPWRPSQIVSDYEQIQRVKRGESEVMPPERAR